MLNKIATAFGVLIAVALGIFIAPYFNKFAANYQDNTELTNNTSSDQSSQEQIYSAPVNDNPPDEKVEIRRDVVGNIFGGHEYQWVIKNVSDQPIEILKLQINNRDDCNLVFKKYTGKSLHTENAKKMGKFHDKGDDVGSMVSESMSANSFSDEIVENSGSKIFQVGYSYKISYPERCGEPVILKTETRFQFIETRF
jgi:hypothetical protein